MQRSQTALTGLEHFAKRNQRFVLVLVIGFFHPFQGAVAMNGYHKNKCES